MNNHYGSNEISEAWDGIVNYLQSKRWWAKVIICALILSAIAIKCSSQVRLSAGVGISNKIFGQMNIGYQYKNYDLQAEVVRGLIQPPSYFGLAPGIVLPTGNVTLRIYAGAYYKVTGFKSTQDRYVHDGSTTVLSSGYEKSHILMGGGLSVQWEHIVLDFAHKDHFRVSVLYSLFEKREK